METAPAARMFSAIQAIPVREMPRDRLKPPRGSDAVQQTRRARALYVENRMAYRGFFGCQPSFYVRR